MLNTKKKKKVVGMELHPGKGVLKREKFPKTRKHSQALEAQRAT